MKTKDKKTTTVTEPAPPVQIDGESKLVLRAQVRPSETNPRKNFKNMEELADSIREQGIIQPLIVRARPPRFTLHEPDLLSGSKNWILLDAHGTEQPFTSESLARQFAGDDLDPYFELVAGERRWRAAGLAKLEKVPVIVREFTTDAEARDVQLIENDARESLDALDEAAAFQARIESGEHTADTLAKLLKKSRSHIFARLGLLKLQGPVREALQGDLPASHAALFATIPTEKMQAKALKEVLEGGEWDYDGTNPKQGVMSFRAAKRHIENKYTMDLAQAPFQRNDETLLEGVGSCADCPKRSGNCQEMFPHIKSLNVCTDQNCFEKKNGANLARAKAKAEAAGLTVLASKETKGMFQYSSEPSLHGTGFMELDAKVPGDAKKRTFEQLLKGDAPAPVVAISPKGKQFEVYRETDLVAAAKAKGFDLVATAKREESKTKEDREHEAKEQEFREKFTDSTLLPALMLATEKKTNSLDDIAEFLRLLVMIKEKTTYDSEFADGLKKGKTKLEKMTLDELKCLFLRAFLTDESGDGGLVGYDGEYSEALPAVCEWAGLDMKAMEKEYRNPALPGEKFEKAAGKTKAKAAVKGKGKKK